ncbi:hypothetical protein CEXT_7061 [Caerostris extrusa]|uniref:Uncharacterized protein n=1 Tax=Caerostris extrusa TaxID=172846 RepID=A0AAV4RE20_CAEEX|nr:hypothetical protein CEXT_7061 [Caerostris extrusa]
MQMWHDYRYKSSSHQLSVNNSDDGLNNGDESVGGEKKKSINKPRSSSTSCVMHAKAKRSLRRSPGISGHYQSQTAQKSQRLGLPLGCYANEEEEDKNYLIGTNTPVVSIAVIVSKNRSARREGWDCPVVILRESLMCQKLNAV